MIKRALPLILALSAWACDSGEDAPSQSVGVQAMRLALPKAEEMVIPMPSSNNLAPSQATFYAFTRGITLNVNGFVRDITHVIEDIIEQPPTETDEETYAVWGPHTDALSPATWRVRVERDEDGAYRYRVEGWPKAQTEAEALTVLSGHHTPGEAVAGGWTFDMTAAHQLDPIAHPAIGEVTMDHTQGQGARALEVTFDEVQGPHDPMINSSLYRYTEAADGAGTFDFISNLDIHEDDQPQLTRRELLQVRARWLASGPGRADIIATHGDLPQGIQADLIECWDSAFMRSYVSMSYAQHSQEDGDAAACPYADRQTPVFEGFDATRFADEGFVEALPEVVSFEGQPIQVEAPVAEPAEQYQFAVDVIEGLNEQVSGVLKTLKEIAANPPSTCTEAACVWGPWTDWDKGISFILIISRQQANEAHGFELKIKRFDAAIDDWDLLLSGGFLKTGEAEGQGFFILDYDVLDVFEPAEVGGRLRAEFMKADGVEAVQARYDDFRYPEMTTPTDLRYFLRTDGQAGALDVRYPADLEEDGVMESVETHIRWIIGQGAGVANVVITRADGEEILGVECWDATAAQTHQAFSLTGEPEIDAACVFADWEAPAFPAMGDE
ncbi:hypothetical protein KKF91_02050 [Myxococcota bacterium]|nr:hypothetical protein [Myxococcota bacterium]MBU1429320.1 hypothetical protein [Myxococcota bacterium]MBU1898019.1 hypothetical protein [Myxococcota bacterium]